MKRSLLYSVLLLAIATTQSCKKKKVQEPEQIETPVASAAPVTYANYTQLKIGNYWIYERFNIDQQGNATSQNVFDSCYVSKDTLIRGQKYFKYNSLSLLSNYKYIRDSLHYTIDSNGEILFSSEDFTTNFHDSYSLAVPGDTIYHSVYKMTDKDAIITTSAGNFTTSNFQKKYTIYPNYNQGLAVRYMNTRYCKNIGMITETQPIFLSVLSTVERRLVRYHLN